MKNSAAESGDVGHQPPSWAFAGWKGISRLESAAMPSVNTAPFIVTYRTFTAQSARKASRYRSVPFCSYYSYPSLT